MKGLLPLHDITGAGSTILADRVPFGIGSQPIARFTCHEPDKKIGQIFRRVPMDLQGTPGLGTCESLPWGRYWRPSLPPSNSRLRQPGDLEVLRRVFRGFAEESRTHGFAPLAFARFAFIATLMFILQRIMSIRDSTYVRFASATDLQTDSSEWPLWGGCHSARTNGSFSRYRTFRQPVTVQIERQLSARSRYPAFLFHYR